MLYQLAHFLRDHLPLVWDGADWLNGQLFAIRYGHRLRAVTADWGKELPYAIVPLHDCATVDVVAFFARQPEEAFRFFHPHGFDNRSIRQLQRNPAFLAYMIQSTGEIGQKDYIGYFFLRSFFWGKCFRGRMVDIRWRGRGLGTQLNRWMNHLGFGLGMRIFETVSRENMASYKSAMAASRCKVIKELKNNDLYLEILK